VLRALWVEPLGAEVAEILRALRVEVLIVAERTTLLMISPTIFRVL
jgi:hypothetical protein